MPEIPEDLERIIKKERIKKGEAMPPVKFIVYIPFSEV